MKRRTYLLAVETALANEGYVVKSFANSQKALYHLVERNKTNSIPYDIVITDVRMPNINGIQLYQILRILDPLSKILFMTGLDAIAELSDLVPDISQQDIWRKPFQNEYLIQKIKEKILSLGKRKGNNHLLVCHACLSKNIMVKTIICINS